MIENITLQFGSSSSKSKLQFEPTSVTVFVGPNNSGKSKALIEIGRYCRVGKTQDYVGLVISDILFKPTSLHDFKVLLQKVGVPNFDENLRDNLVQIRRLNGIHGFQQSSIQPYYAYYQAKIPNNGGSYFGNLLGFFVLSLDGTTRLGLLDDRPAGDLKTEAQTILGVVFSNDQLRKEIRRIVFDAFGKYLVVDPTNIGNLCVRLSDVPPSDEREERGWDAQSVAFHSKASRITDASDGVKAFAGIISTLIAGESLITLIDEPEAFLHPPLAFKLGKEMSILSKKGKGHLFISTHSASFLMGCIQSGVPLNIIRLTYKNGLPTARILSQEKVTHLMRHPLLRSTGLLNGLFYDSVVVTEADSDRAFYQEINERLLAEGDKRGIENCLFLNAQNKQTVWEIVEPLRELGIPTVGIVDIDVVKEGGQVFNKPLKAGFFPELNYDGLRKQREVVLNALNSTLQDWKRNGGLTLLNPSGQEACNNFFDQLDEYGVFVVRNGELESWLKQFAIPGKAPSWLIETFIKMGENPDEPGYLKPTTGDVWDFLARIKKWIENPLRKGLPQ